MANFVEQATLRVNDQSSAQIRKINAELKKLQATANSLKSVTINLRINTGQLQAASRQLNALAHNMAQLRQHSVTLNVNTSGIQRAQQQLAALRRAAGRPITVPTAGGGGAGRGGGGGGVGGRGARVPGGGTLIPTGSGGFLRGMASVVVGGTVYAIGANLMRGVLDGIKEVDTGETSLMLKQLDRIYGDGAQVVAKGMLVASQEAATLKPYGGAFWNLGQRAQNFSEMLGVTSAMNLQDVDAQGRPRRGRPSGLPEYRPALEATSQLEEMTRVLVGLGQSSEKATEQAMNFAKGLEQTGRFTDRLTGQFDTEKMKASFDYFRQLMPTIGKEFSGDFARQMIKYLSTEKYTVSDKALGAVMLMGEEMGTRAAVGYHQAVKQLSGQGQKKPQLAFMLEEGLLQTAGYKTVGKGKRAKQVPIVGDVVDQDMLREDLPQWINKHLVPILEKRGRAEAKALVESGEISSKQFEAHVEKYKTDPTKIAALASKVVGDRTAVETVTGFLERSQEIQRQLNEVALRSGKPEDVRKATQFSINIATAQLANQFKGAAGVIAQKAAPWLVPQMQRAANEFSNISTDFERSLAKGEVPVNAMERISNALTPVALGAAIASAVADPTKAPAAMATIGLITAGNLLIKAANTLMKKPEGEGPFGQPPPKTPEEFKAQELRRQLAVKEKERDDAAKQNAQLEQSVADDRRTVALHERAVAAGRRVTQGARDTYVAALQRIQAYDATTAAQAERITTLEGEITTLKRHIIRAEAEEMTGKKYDDQMVKWLEARKAEALESEEERKRVKAMTPKQRKAYWAAKEKWAPMPRPRPLDIVEDQPVEAAEVAVRALKYRKIKWGKAEVEQPVTVPPPPAVVPPAAAPSIVPGAPGAPAPTFPGPRAPLAEADFSAAREAFSSIFGTGKTTIEGAGTTAASRFVSDSTAGAGSIGAAAASAFLSQVSGATINVNANVTPTVTAKADAGHQVA